MEFISFTGEGRIEERGLRGGLNTDIFMNFRGGEMFASIEVEIDLKGRSYGERGGKMSRLDC